MESVFFGLGCVGGMLLFAAGAFLWEEVAYRYKRRHCPCCNGLFDRKRLKKDGAYFCSKCGCNWAM